MRRSGAFSEERTEMNSHQTRARVGPARPAGARDSACSRRRWPRPARHRSPASSPTRAAPRRRASPSRPRTRPRTSPTPPSRTRPATTPSRPCPIGTYVVKAELTGLQDRDHAADHARGEADRPPRLQAGRGRARGHGRGHGARRPSCRPSRPRSARCISGNTVAVAAAQRPQHRPARAAAARDGHLQPARLHEHRQREHEPPVRERQPRADQQLHGRRPRRERDDRQPRRATSRAPTRSPRSASRPTTTRPTSATSAGRVISNVIKSGANQFRGNAVRVLPEQRLRREHLGEQPLGRAAPGAQAAHLRRHPRRPDRQGQAVLLRRLPGLAPGRARLRDGVGGAGGVAPRRPVERHDADPRSADRPALPGQPDPREPHQPDGARAPERPGELPAAEPRRCPAASPGNFVGETLVHDPRPPGRPAPRLERVARTTSSSCASRSRPTRTQRDKQRLPARSSRRATTSRSGTWRFNWSRVFGPSVINEVLVGYSNTTVDRARPTTGPASATATRSYGIAGGQPIDGLSQIGWGSGLTLAGRHRDRLRHARQDLPAQREAHLAQGPPRLQVRRPVPALRPAALLRRQQRPARLHQLQRRLHGLRVLRLPARPGVEQGPRRRRPERPLDAPAEPHRRSSSRTTSRSRRT